MSAFYIDLLGPLHWMSKCQKVSAGSSAEAKIYATDECVKFLLELVQVMEFLDIKHIFMPDVNLVYNDSESGRYIYQRNERHFSLITYLMMLSTSCFINRLF
jgi:hypothetical protein